MKASDIEEILEIFARGDISQGQAAEKLQHLSFQDIGYARVDHARSHRQGFPEVIFGIGKTPEQIAGIFSSLLTRPGNIIVTRASAEAFRLIEDIYPDAEYHSQARLIRVFRDRSDRGIGEITIACAGTSDIPVAEEAALTAETMGNRVQRIWDAGVAGIHRILGERERLQNSRAVIVVAGMEGALPSVVGGLVSVPVIGVPTSIGYGSAFGGVAALLGMLNSCSSNVSVVNIDNGFGAGFSASLINRRRDDDTKQ